MLSNFENGSWQLIDSVPTAEIKRLEQEYPTEYVVTGQIGNYYVSWNVNQNLLPADSELTGVEAAQANAEIRRALSLMIDRNYIVNEITQAGQVPASGFVPMGMTDADGTEFYMNAGHSEDYYGYYDVSEDAYMSNWDEAIEILKKYYEYDEATYMFTNAPARRVPVQHRRVPQGDRRVPAGRVGRRWHHRQPRQSGVEHLPEHP